ncbi:alpha-amylase family glycosyl hydrolase [Bacillus albus]|uniref:alpha-amylase family glycosyl hydrolase n=1 Tax=Bacillus TaxID=1386 RepID=UPI00200194F2|nr:MULTISPECIES: alpha-amylase family glycosyl hydrolase [Bacillus]MDA2216111.1 alpha-amylase family glycosyl hydrolase [Bacillus cereus group sp. Bc228]MDA2227624.1 alpha-amylase family glycosyl hydrolase [Bacillus cereus group sp. Bc227]MDA2260948.1 alpha-amylase family glycosyl hydrolase [Bacillus cereus group sp. Bc200]MDA2321801.1 alpha-amylase family glycosyl hydrolase [Bacillus cereus group sp. Bc177]UPL45473.1 alpha-amylase family glycosyl hydrolase [Bacillus sp. PGP15]
MRVGKIHTRKLFIYFCLAVVLFVPIHTFADEKREWRDEVIYSIMIDRFNNGEPKNDKQLEVGNLEGYQGGDVRGIIKRLDYIKEMGFTTVMLSPLFESGKYDGLDVRNFQKVNEHFGTENDVKELVQAAHAKGMKIVLQFPLGENEQQVIDAMKWWIKEVDLDASYVIHSEKKSRSFWDDVQKDMQAIKKDFRIMTKEDSEYNEKIVGAFSKADVSVKPLYDVSKKDRESTTFLDNQDTKRFARIAKENMNYPPSRLKLALTYLLTTPGIPNFYYGTEIALDGGDTPDNRRLMDFKSDEKFMQHITKLGELRQSRPSLRRGTFELLYDKDGMSVLKRKYKDEVTVVAINNTKETQKVALPVSAIGEKQELRGLLEDEIIREENGNFYLVLKREESNVYKVNGETGVNWLFICLIVGVNVLFIAFLLAVKKRRK